MSQVFFYFITFERRVCLLKQLINQHFLKVVLDKYLNSPIIINDVLHIKHEILKESHEYEILLFLIFYFLKQFANKYISFLHYILYKITYLQIFLDELGLLFLHQLVYCIFSFRFELVLSTL